MTAGAPSDPAQGLAEGAFILLEIFTMQNGFDILTDFAQWIDNRTSVTPIYGVNNIFIPYMVHIGNLPTETLEPRAPLKGAAPRIRGGSGGRPRKGCFNGQHKFYLK